MPGYFVSRQMQYYSGRNMVEIAACLDTAGADMIGPEFRSLGEFREFIDPREAAEAAIAVWRAWKKKQKNARLTVTGYVGGACGMEGEPMTLKEVKAWADTAYEKADKCAECGSILGEERSRYRIDSATDDEFCSEFCAEKCYNRMCKESEEEQHA